MKSPLKHFAILVVGGAALASLAPGARPLHAAPANLVASNPQQSMNTSVCATYKPPKSAAKFTGRIQAAPSGTSFELNAGNENAEVTYGASTSICQGGQSTTAEALIAGKSVTVYGETNRNGKTYRVAAAMIMVEGAAASAPRMASNTPRTNANMGSNSNAPAPKSDSSGPSQTPTGSNVQQNLRNPGASGISCQSMTFSISGIGAPGAGSSMAGGRMEVDGLTCIRPVDQQSMQLLSDSMKAERMATAALTWQNVFVATLTNAFVSSVTFTASGSQPVAVVTFRFTRMDLQPAMGGAAIAINGKP
jgi:hypothetical protein